MIERTVGENILAPENPSCLQATAASVLSQLSSHTVPQAAFWQTSTRPSLGVEPPMSLMSPFEQTGQIVIQGKYSMHSHSIC